MNSRMLIRGAPLAGALTLLHASVALAAAGGESTPLHLSGSGSSTTHAASTGGSIVRTIVGLFVVIAVIYGIAWVLRRYKGGRGSKASGTALSSVATLPLGQNRALSLVRVGRDLVLLGIAEGSVTAIRRYSEEEALELGLEKADWEEPDDEGFGGGGGNGSSGRLVDALRRLTVR
jgi:flagellar protein FliO/FliZ